MNTSPPSDQELLLRFHEHRSEVAFTELYQRYAPLVLAVCRRVLRNPHLAEDAASAVLLVLAKEAGTMSRDTRPLGAWLHRVATNIARDVWRREHRRQVREQVGGAAATSEPDAGAAAELQARLHLEIERLPEKYRTAIVLHHLEGQSHEAAAAALRLSYNTFVVRLKRGRELLAKRLRAAGDVEPTPAGLQTILLLPAVALSPAFTAATCQAAAAVAAGKTLTGSGLVSAKVAYLIKSALKTLFWAKVKTAAVAVAVTGMVGGGGLAATLALVHRPPPPKPATAVPALVTPPPATSGSVWAWGDNQYGQLGNGTTNDSPNPMPVPGLDGVIAVAAGFGHTLVLKSDSTVWACGRNQSSQLGDGTTTDRRTPVPVRTADGTPLNGITAVAAGMEHTVALTRDGGVLQWGRGLAERPGQPADRSFADVSSGVPKPVQLSGSTALAAGDNHTLALRRDHTVWAWGLNDHGQLGDGTKTHRPTPVQVKLPDGSPLSGIIALAAGSNGSVALRNDHTVWTWGHFGRSDKIRGKLVNGTETLTPVPVQLAEGAQLADVTAIAAGNGHAVALRSDTTVWVWGGNRFGQLGGGTKEYTPTPVQVKLPDGSPLTGVIALASGDRRTAALRNDRTVWEWGSVPSELRTGPVQVKLADGRPLSGITAIAAGSMRAVAIEGE